MPSNLVAEIVVALQARHTFLLSTHLGPDGDAIGSLLAIRRVLIALGKTCEAVHVEGVPPLLQWLPEADAVLTAPSRSHYEAAIIVDSGDRKRVALPEGALERCELVIDIDHHDPTRAFGQLNWVDPHACATAELVITLAQELGVTLDAAVATQLYAAIASDTGGFRYSNTTPTALRMAAALVEHGAEPEVQMKRLFHERSVPTLKLLGIALAQAVTELDGRLVWSVLRRDDYTAVGATDADTEGVIDLLRSARGCEVCALFRVTERGRTKGSLRCEAPLVVDTVAALFGGGGHPLAAGFSSDRCLDEIVAETLVALRLLL